MLGWYISAPCRATLQLHFWSTTIGGKGERKEGGGEGGQRGKEEGRTERDRKGVGEGKTEKVI